MQDILRIIVAKVETEVVHCQVVAIKADQALLLLQDVEGKSKSESCEKVFTEWREDVISKFQTMTAMYVLPAMEAVMSPSLLEYAPETRRVMRNIRTYFYDELNRLKEKVVEYSANVQRLQTQQYGLVQNYDERVHFTTEPVARVVEICHCID